MRLRLYNFKIKHVMYFNGQINIFSIIFIGKHHHHYHHHHLEPKTNVALYIVSLYILNNTLKTQYLMVEKNKKKHFLNT